MDVVVTEYAPNEPFAYERREAGFRRRVCMHLETEPVGGGTRVTVRTETVLPPDYPLWWWLLLVPFRAWWLLWFRPICNRRIRVLGSRLKEYYETPAA